MAMQRALRMFWPAGILLLFLALAPAAALAAPGYPITAVPIPSASPSAAAELRRRAGDCAPDLGLPHPGQPVDGAGPLEQRPQRHVHERHLRGRRPHRPRPAGLLELAGTGGRQQHRLRRHRGLRPGRQHRRPGRAGDGGQPVLHRHAHPARPGHPGRPRGVRPARLHADEPPRPSARGVLLPGQRRERGHRHDRPQDPVHLARADGRAGGSSARRARPTSAATSRRATRSRRCSPTSTATSG